MFTITSGTNTTINMLLATLRESDKASSLMARKVFGNIKNKEFTVVPTTGADLVAVYNGAESPIAVVAACARIIDSLEFEEIDESDADDVEVPEIPTTNVIERFAFIENTDFTDMTARQLTLCMFKDIGTEEETKIVNMNTGLKLKLDLLDELKATLVDGYPDIRVESLEAKLANALAVTKLEKGSSLALVDGNLALYTTLSTTKTIDAKNFKFLAAIGGDKTMALDTLILQSTFRSYKELIAQGELEPTANEFNLAVMRTIQGIKKVSDTSKEAIRNLF